MSDPGINIYFELKGGLSAQIPPGETVLEEGPGWTVTKLIEKLGLPRHEVGNVVVNGKMAGGGTPLKSGDRVTFFPVIAGG